MRNPDDSENASAGAAPAVEVSYGDGWYGWEHDRVFPFRWMTSGAKIVLPADVRSLYRFAVLPVFSEYVDFSQKLRVETGNGDSAEWPLLYQWSFYSLDLRPEKPSGEGTEASRDPVEIDLSLNKIFPARYHPGDGRELGVRIGPFTFHNDPRRHELFKFFIANAVLNFEEMVEGRDELRSYPLNLGIDLYGKCNIKPPCVYCLWDKMKTLEGPYVDMTIDDRTLESYGPFFKAARNLVNCSFGEPLLHPRFQEILELCRRSGKFLELSTNGQAFTERTIRALAGKPVYLYVSLDAATAATYAKIRNDRWEEIIPRLEQLSRERKKAGGFPKLFMVFMPMRVNLGDLEAYFELCRRLEADALVLRPLLYLWNPKIEADRGGYHFDYKKEMLERSEAEEVIRRCEHLSVTYGVPLANQYSFGLIPEPGSGSRET
ncbi:MAG: radical SAM protein [Candidatus Aminicenantes bacterium]|nr:radical SAM protein [Candidatus Aminicenantes bacterium]